MGTRAAMMTAEAAGVGPALQGTSQTAVSTVEAQDDHNATQIQGVGHPPS